MPNLRLLLWRCGRILGYWRLAQSRHGIHSPFVYDLLDKVIYDCAYRPDYALAEQAKAAMLSDGRLIGITDFGAGSSINSNRQRKVSSIAEGSAKQRKYGRLLHRLTAHFQPMEMLELGTSLGISAIYQASGCPQGRLVTFEGCPQTVAIAQENLSRSAISNTAVVVGNFDHTLSAHLDSIHRLDWAFIDGNHRKEPTLRYFHQCLEKSHPGTVLVFDDINWSPEMTEAWEVIKAHGLVTVTLDLFQLGIAFLREGQAKQHFVIRY